MPLQSAEGISLIAACLTTVLASMTADLDFAEDCESPCVSSFQGGGGTLTLEGTAWLEVTYPIQTGRDLTIRSGVQSF